MSKYLMSIDLGSSNIVVCNSDGVVLLNEPSVVAVCIQNSSFDNVAFGNEALRYITENTHAQLVYPIKSGAVDNTSALSFLISGCIARLVPKKFFKTTIQALVSVSCGLTNVEKRIVEESCIKGGVKEIVIIESPISVSTLLNNEVKFLIDIGASKTEISIVGENGILSGCSIDIGGNSIDNAIIDYISDKYKLLISPRNSEDVKLNIGSLINNDTSTISIKGRVVLQNTSSEVKLTAVELRPVIIDEIDKIISVIESVSLMIPEDQANNIVSKGFTLTGGVSLMPGIVEYLQEKLYIDITRLDDPSTAVARGGANFFRDKVKLNRMINVENLNI